MLSVDLHARAKTLGPGGGYAYAHARDERLWPWRLEVAWLEMATGKNSPEYQKVKKSFPKLTKAIAVVIGPTCDYLLAAGLITNGQKAKAKNGMIDANDRASDLVSLILSKVEQDEKYFYTFVDVLKEDLDTFQTVLNHMGISTGSGKFII